MVTPDPPVIGIDPHKASHTAVAIDGTASVALAGPSEAYVGVAHVTNPVWYASTTTWTRSRRPSFWRTCVTWVFTVVSLM